MAEDRTAAINYNGPAESVECAHPGCTNRLRRAAFTDEPQFCSREHRDGRSAAKGYSKADLERDTMTPAKQEARSAARTLPEYRLNLTPKEAAKGRRILTRLNDWLATDARYAVVPQEVLDHLGGLLAECYRAEREGADDATT